MWRALKGIFARDLALAWRQRADVLSSLVFFVMVVSLFPLGLGPEPATLRAIAPGVLWVAALLSSTLALGRLFAGDHADGTLEQMLLAPQPLAFLVLSKIAAHWVAAGLPLTAMAPLLGLQFDMAPADIAVLTATLALGTPALSLIGAIGAALTVGLRGAAVLVPLLVLPLAIPVLIFGAGAVDAAEAGRGAGAHLSLLGGLLAFALAGAPLACAAALRISLD
ncbi:MAG: heme exporter protein CcmB [Burkholderiales bacterium]|nr:heme exporter protein CcmB [Burkholderiales bacterium]